MNSYDKIQLMRQWCEISIVTMLGKDTAPKWWSSKNKAFGMKTPNEMFDENPEVVYNYLVGQTDGYG